MCGIYGLWSPRRSLPDDAIADLLAHRGPDDHGAWSDGEVQLGHRRLSIVDLSTSGRQPLSTPDGRFVLTYNGEIYNYLELRQELEASGVVFVSECDTEVLLQGYATWGPAVLDRLYGMFAFAVWDRDQRTLFLARDATGIKPLYFRALSADEFAFASEVKAFTAFADVPFEIDQDVVDDYLGAGFAWRGDRSSIRGVRKLSAGHCLFVRQGVITEVRRWWQPPRPLVAASVPESVPESVSASVAASGTNEATVDETMLDREADALLALLDEVVAQHLRADVPIGLLLSGGLDSSVLAAIASRHVPRLRTVTLGFEPYAKDERAHARSVAEWIGSEHHEMVVRPADAATELFANAHHLDDLFGDSGVVPAFAAFRFCRQLGLKVVLVGEGADEIFGGYPPFRALSNGAWPRAMNPYRFFRAYTRRRYGRELPRFWALIRRLEREAGDDLFHAVRLFETQVQLPSSLNRKVDHASMAYSLEARVPFQDRRVLEFLFRLPKPYFLDGDAGKRLLRHMARRHRLVPEAILARTKMGTPIPWEWLRDGAFAAAAVDTLLAPNSWTHQLGYAKIVRSFFDGSEWRYPGRLWRRWERHANRGWLVMNLLFLDAWANSRLFEPQRDGSSPGDQGPPGVCSTASTGSVEIT